MAFDVGLGELIGGLFGFGGDVAAADVAAAAVPEIAAGTAADIGAAAAPELVGGAAADSLGGAAAADAATAAAAPEAVDLALGGATAADATIPAAVEAAGAENLGTTVGGVGNALDFAPTPADAAATTGGLTGGASAAGTTAPAAAGPVDTIGAAASPAQELAGNPNIAAELDSASAAPVTEPTSAQSAIAGQTVPTQPSPITGAGPQSEVGASALAMGQLPAEGGLAAEAGGDTAAALGSAPAAAAQPGLVDSLNSGASSIVNSPITKLAELGLPLGFLGYTLAKGPAPIPPQAQEAVDNAKSNLTGLTQDATQNVPLFNQTAATDLAEANAFEISPAQAATISSWKQDQYNQLLQQIANRGTANPMSSSDWVQGKAQIDQQAITMQTQMVTQLINTAFQSASAANAGISTATNVTSALDSTLMQAANLQVQQDAAFNSAIGSALQSFGLLAALSSFGSNKGAGASPNVA